jgi:hypothetical protein
MRVNPIMFDKCKARGRKVHGFGHTRDIQSTGAEGASTSSRNDGGAAVLPIKLSSDLVLVGYNVGMVVHTFAFRWKAGVSEVQKLRALAEIRGLQGQIPGLLETWVGVNVSPRSLGYELGGVMKFTDRSALDAYGAHPVHQKLLQWLVPLIDPIEVDFEA